MKKTLICKIVALAVAGISLSSTCALAGSDDFNRAHLTTRWTVKAGSLSISKDELVGASGSLGYLKGSNSDTAASAVVFLHSTDTEYGAIALGNIGGGNNAFVKIQAQDAAGTFDHAAFYTGNNGSGTFFALSTPVPSPAILDVFFCGTTATMRITSAAGVQTYTNNYGTTYGPGGGLGTYGSVGLDNYVSNPGGCGGAPADAIPASEMPPARDLSLVK